MKYYYQCELDIYSLFMHVMILLKQMRQPVKVSKQSSDDQVNHGGGCANYHTVFVLQS